MNGLNDPLSQLRDIHTPDPISIWPPAPGWWALFALGIGAIVWSLWWYRRWRSSGYRLAQNQLKRLREDYLANHQELTLVVELSMLIRRYCLSVYGREQTAGLTGIAWLGFLDRKGETHGFTSGVGRVLQTVPYGGRDAVQGEALIGLVEQWLKRTRKGKP